MFRKTIECFNDDIRSGSDYSEFFAKVRLCKIFTKLVDPLFHKIVPSVPQDPVLIANKSRELNERSWTVYTDSGSFCLYPFLPNRIRHGLLLFCGVSAVDHSDFLLQAPGTMQYSPFT